MKIVYRRSVRNRGGCFPWVKRSTPAPSSDHPGPPGSRGSRPESNPLQAPFDASPPPSREAGTSLKVRGFPTPLAEPYPAFPHRRASLGGVLDVPQGGVGGGQDGHGNAEGGAAHVIQPHLVAELYAPGIPPVLAADPQLYTGVYLT